MKTVALDSMLFIYLFESDPRYIALVDPIFEQLEQGKLHGVTSMVTPLEILAKPKLTYEPENLAIFTQFFTKTPHLEVVPMSWEIVLIAAQIRRTYSSIKTPDSLQLATAQVKKTDIFITHDKKILNLNSFPVKIVPLENYK